MAVSSSLLDYLVLRARVNRSKLHLIANGVDIQRFKPLGRGGLRRALGLKETTILLGTVARLDPIKNLSLVFEPLRRLIAAGLDAHYVIVGEGVERTNVMKLASAAGVASRVQLLGLVENTAVLYSDLDVFVLPSLMEGTSVSLLEAMASGVACVATRVGGNASVLADGSAGMLIPSGDTDALARALFALLDQDGTRERLGRAGRQRVEDHYSLSAMVDRYEGLYLRLMRRPT